MASELQRTVRKRNGGRAIENRFGGWLRDPLKPRKKNEKCERENNVLGT